jgi:hypothetical protein
VILGYESGIWVGVKANRKRIAWETKSYMAKSLGSIWEKTHNHVEPKWIDISRRIVQCVGIEVHAGVYPGPLL